MTEFAPSSAGHRGTNSASAPTVSTGLEYPVEALVRDDDAAPRALLGTRRFVRLVSEFDEASCAAVNVRTGIEQGRLDVTLEVHGAAAQELTKADLVSALGLGVFLGDPSPLTLGPLPETPTSYELVRTSVTPFRSLVAEDFSRPDWATRAELAADGPGFSAPFPNENDSGEHLLAAMARSDRQLWVRTLLGAADHLAEQMVVDELNASMTRQGVADYARVPLLARTVVVSSNNVPVAVRAALRQRGSGLRLIPLPACNARALWTNPLAALRSGAVGETHAVAITRIPTAGAIQSLGVATRRPVVPERPLDPMPPAPGHPVRLGRATDAFGESVDVELDAGDLVRHCFIEGQTGSGKSSTLLQLFWSITRAGYQAIYLDPHGDGAARAAAYSSALEETGTYYVRHGDREHPVRINPLSEGDVEGRERVLSELLELIQAMLDPRGEGMVGERFKRTFTLVAQAAFELFGRRTSITDVLALALRKDSLRALAQAIARRSPDTTARLEAELFSLGDREFADLISWFSSRLQPFLRTPSLREIIGTGEDSIDMLDLLDSGKNLVVDLAALELGENVARVIGALWLLKLRNAMGRRSSKRPIVLLVDEAHLYTFGALPGLLAEGRKFGVSVVVATQDAGSLSPPLARAVEANCASSISLRLGINGAPSASDRLGGWSPMQLTRLPDLTAAASLSRGGIPTQPFTLHIDHFDVVAKAGWDDSRVEAASTQIAEASSELLWAPYADCEVLNDAQVIGSVKAAALARRERTPAPNSERHPLAGSPDTDSLLDRWLASRGQAQDLRFSAAAEDEEKDEQFDIVLDDKGPRPTEVIEIIRGTTGRGLAEARAAIERPGAVIMTSGSGAEAHALAEQMRAAGATARVVPASPAANEGAR